MIYLVEGTVHTVAYMADDEESEDVTRLVSANSLMEAELKFRKFFVDQTKEYSIYVRVEGVKGYETIQ